LGGEALKIFKMEDGMGRGDGRSRRGKIFKGSYGKTRVHRVKKAVHVTTAKPVVAKKSPAPKKTKA
jgi:30S ribosomal protein S31